MSERQIWAGLKSRWPSLFDDKETRGVLRALNFCRL